jgi:hypothetical protein
MYYWGKIGGKSVRMGRKIFGEDAQNKNSPPFYKILKVL